MKKILLILLLIFPYIVNATGPGKGIGIIILGGRLFIALFMLLFFFQLFQLLKHKRSKEKSSISEIGNVLLIIIGVLVFYFGYMFLNIYLGNDMYYYLKIGLINSIIGLSFIYLGFIGSVYNKNIKKINHDK